MSLLPLIVALPLAGMQSGANPVAAPQAAGPAAVEQTVATPGIDANGQSASSQTLALPVLATEPVEPDESDDSVVVTARPAPPPSDPLQQLNVETFHVVQSVDQAVTGPVARGYSKAVPSPIRSGLRNVLRNLTEPVVFLNYLLQFKPGKSAETFGRFAINSTIGAVGLFDVAKKRPFKLPYRSNGLGNTLGYYGVKQGPFMYLPLMGPTTVRDLIGRIGDLSVLPFAVGKPFNNPLYAIPTTVIRLIDERAEADDEIQDRRDNSADPYSDLREDYLRRREAEIEALHGRGSPTPNETGGKQTEP